ncbi:hypothetical protein [Acidianus manzaensis]|uniref:Uncharacterized protein n=1 Tax=Acidianus manzaensis TaxID=282676 RepID=A0A1W6JY18_9CREN|nr:hypothetical protein [Acidianus manzaensis]ARM75147.1 hypothetical protein B6F84_03260 [Acidianus manzaensis]
MSIESKFTSFTNEEIKVGEALAHIVSAASIVEALEGESKDIDEIVSKYVDLWIFEMAPIEYYPGLAEMLGSRISRKLTQIFDEISEDEFGTTLDDALQMKKSIDNGEIVYNYADLEVRIERVLRGLGVNINDFGSILETNDYYLKMKRLLGLLTVAIGIASVRGKWIAESQ